MKVQVIEKKKGRINRTTGEEIKGNLRVCAYARVSTENKFDMIITKSISRFGRNTVDTLKYVRLLKEKGITIYFEEEHINTLELSGEIMLTILFSYDEKIKCSNSKGFLLATI